MITLDYLFLLNEKDVDKSIYVSDAVYSFTIYSFKSINIADIQTLLKYAQSNKPVRLGYTNEIDIVIFNIILLCHKIYNENNDLFYFTSDVRNSDIIVGFVNNLEIKSLLKKNLVMCDYYKYIQKDKLQHIIPFFRFNTFGKYRFLEADELSFDKSKKCTTLMCLEKNKLYDLFFDRIEAFDNSVTIKIDNEIQYELLDSSPEPNKYVKLQILNVNFNIKKGDNLLILGDKNKYQGNFTVLTEKPLVVENIQSLNFKDFFKIHNITLNNDDKNLLFKEGIQNRKIIAISNSKTVGAYVSQGPVWFKDVRVQGYIYKYKGVYVARITSDLKTEYDGNEECFGNPNIMNKVICEKSGFVWDARCKHNSECPFFDSKRGTGGCNLGYCEVPLGVERVAFKQYEYESNNKGAFCHGCKNKESPHCCKDQKNPQYAFAGDKRYRKGIIVKESFTQGENEIFNIKLFPDLVTYFEKIDSKFTPIYKNYLRKKSDDMRIEFASLNLIDGISHRFKYYASFCKTNKYFTNAKNNTEYFSTILVIQYDREDSDKAGIIIVFDCIYDKGSDMYYYTNIAVRKDTISQDKLIFLSKKALYDLMMSRVVFD
jgi:hypothetical protein